MYNDFQKPQVIFDYVNSMDAAKAYAVPFGYKALLMDTQSPTFYWKEYVAQTGQMGVTAYDFVQHKEPEKPKEITREEIQEMIAEALKGNKVE